MGFQAQVQKSPTANNNPQGKGGNVTYSATSGQPNIGDQNPYPNTVGQWDNQGNQPMFPLFQGKGQ